MYFLLRLPLYSERRHGLDVWGEAEAVFVSGVVADSVALGTDEIEGVRGDEIHRGEGRRAIGCRKALAVNFSGRARRGERHVDAGSRRFHVEGTVSLWDRGIKEKIRGFAEFIRIANVDSGSLTAFEPQGLSLAKVDKTAR